MKATTRLISSAGVTSLPGLAGTPPTSTMSAPSATTSCTRSSAAASSQVTPGRENEAGRDLAVAQPQRTRLAPSRVRHRRSSEHHPRLACRSAPKNCALPLGEEPVQGLARGAHHRGRLFYRLLGARHRRVLLGGGAQLLDLIAQLRVVRVK